MPTLVLLFHDQFNNGYFQRLWWIQDGAPAHSGQSLFGNRVLPVNHENKWLPRLPNLTPCDFSL